MSHVPVSLPLALALVAAAPADVPEVEPSALGKGSEWLDHQVRVDGRVDGPIRLGPSNRFDRFHIKGCPAVLFRLPPNLAYRNQPNAPAVRVKGTLKSEGGRLIFKVDELQIVPGDLDRLKQKTALLRPDDYSGRAEWAEWARRRAATYDATEAEPKKELEARARGLEGEAIRIEADKSNRSGPERWLELAERGRKFGVPEPEPSALAHRAFRGMLSKAKKADDFRRIVARIEAFFPGAIESTSPVAEDLRTRYGQDVQAAYRSASEVDRRSLDRLLLADAIEKSLTRREAASPRALLDLAEQAHARLPDRPEIERNLKGKALEAAEAEVGSLRRDEIGRYAAIYREDLGRPEEGRKLYQRWLDARRRKLPVSDATGRIALAEDYEQMLGDREAARDLLIDSADRLHSAEAVDQLRGRGWVRRGGRWALAASKAPEEDRNGDGPRRLEPEGSLVNATREKVRETLGAPSKVARSVSAGQVIEQWIYRGPRSTQYINFLHRLGTPQATVVGYYSLP